MASSVSGLLLGHGQFGRWLFDAKLTINDLPVDVASGSCSLSPASFAGSGVAPSHRGEQTRVEGDDRSMVRLGCLTIVLCYM